MAKDLKNHLAVITGASSGLGEEYARQLAARGADLVIVARRVERLETLAAELARAHGVQIQVIKADLSLREAARQVFEQAIFGGRQVTMLINNAGIGPFTAFINSPVVKHVNTIQLNTVALTELSHLFANHMLKHGKTSHITNVGSVASYQGCPNFAVYAATKHYVRVFSEIIRWELKSTNVSVTCLCPGGATTEFSASNGQKLSAGARRFMMSASAVVKEGIDGMLRGEAVVVPGLINKIACFLPRLLPMALSLAIAHHAMARNATPESSDPRDSAGTS